MLPWLQTIWFIYGGHSGCCIRKSLVEGMTDEAPYKGDVTVTIVRMSDYALYNEE